MRTIYPGHRYKLRQLDGHSEEVLQFVQRAPLHVPTPGTTNQEVCRALIDRVKVLDAEKPWWGNRQILHNLRQVIILHEIRAYGRKLEKAGIERDMGDSATLVQNWVNTRPVSVEEIPVGDDGHWVIPL